MTAPSDVAVGTELPEQTFRVTRADLVRYAGASGDFNPIHWNERVATSVGLPDVIAHGMFTMALDRDLVGRSYPPSAVYEVGRAKIAEFAAAIGDASPVYRDADAARAAGHPDVIAPPTFAIVVSLEAAMAVLDDPDVGIDYSRVVHGEQRFVHHRPITAGDSVIGTLTVDSVREAGGHAMVTTRTELATEGGEALCTSTSTIVIRGGE